MNLHSKILLHARRELVQAPFALGLKSEICPSIFGMRAVLLLAYASHCSGTLHHLPMLFFFLPMKMLAIGSGTDGCGTCVS